MNLKAIKVKVYVDRSNGSTTNIYPPVVLENKQSIPMWLYPDGRDTETTDETGTWRWCVAFVSEDVADLFLASDLCVAAKQDEVDAFDAAENKQREIITDQPAVLSVLAKAARGAMLSADDQKVIDPNDPRAGIVRSKTYSETLAASGHAVVF